eukprot:7067571-Prymnesium_polylepis.2
MRTHSRHLYASPTRKRGPAYKTAVACLGCGGVGPCPPPCDRTGALPARAVKKVESSTKQPCNVHR